MRVLLVVWTAVAISGIGVAVSGQEPGMVSLSVSAGAIPLFHAFGVASDIRVWSGVSLIGSARSLRRVGYWGCIESSPSPCVPDGLSLGLGLRLTADSSGSWWPYAEVLAGGHRYSTVGKWSLFVAGGAGFGWYIGSRSTLRVGFEYERIPADPPTLAEWARDGAKYNHAMAGLVISIGIKVR